MSLMFILTLEKDIITKIKFLSYTIHKGSGAADRTMPFLSKYKEKRDFRISPEPEGRRKKGGQIFVIQEHHATRLHYDFRLEHKGVLKSWAVPKGLPMEASEKRLAIQTEDHPLDYANFAGKIPDGQYGAGMVYIWDSGTFENLSEKDGRKISIGEAIEKGHVKVMLNGKRIHGTFSLIKTKGNWLMLSKDASLEKIEISHPEKMLFKKGRITKKEFVEYYEKVAPYMLPHLAGRPISMLRFPDGAGGKEFFQKNVPDYFPDWIRRVPISHNKGITTYAVCDDEPTLAYLASQVMVPHIWLSRVDNLRKPDKMIFDLDPKLENFRAVYTAARAIHDLLDDLKLENFVMSTGSKGLHIVVPIEPNLDFSKVGNFSRVIAGYMEGDRPKHMTAQHRKDKRQASLFVDTYRNAYSQTSVAPYAVRSIGGAPIAAPLEWDEVKPSFDPQRYNIKNIFRRLKRKGDIWQDIYSLGQSLKSLAKGKTFQNAAGQA